MPRTAKREIGPTAVVKQGHEPISAVACPNPLLEALAAATARRLQADLDMTALRGAVAERPAWELTPGGCAQQLGAETGRRLLDIVAQRSAPDLLSVEDIATAASRQAACKDFVAGVADQLCSDGTFADEVAQEIARPS